MGIVRLVVLAVLGYIAWLLIRGLMGRTPPAGSGAKKQAGPEAKVQDVLVEDPVCHTLVPKNQAIRLRQGGKTYYFCSDACCDKFAGKARGEQ